MKKLAQITCLFTVLVLSSLSTVHAIPASADEGYGYCEVFCGDHYETFITLWSDCCRQNFYCSNGYGGTPGWSWTSTYDMTYYC